MLGSTYEGQNCSIARALESVGERWTLLIVRELLRGPQRFSDLAAALDISKNVLAARLDKLVDLKIVAKSQYEAARDWNEYSLTRKGYDLFPVVNALMAWGDRYEAPDRPTGRTHAHVRSSRGARGGLRALPGAGEPQVGHRGPRARRNRGSAEVVPPTLERSRELAKQPVGTQDSASPRRDRLADPVGHRTRQRAETAHSCDATGVGPGGAYA